MKRKRIAMLLAFLLLVTAVMPASAASVAISKNSVTIEAGSTYQLSVLVDGQAASAQAWGSSDSSVATVDQNGLVTGQGKGSAVITAMVNGVSAECLVSVVEQTSKSISRYSVLILDASGSMRGKALKREKEAAKRFCKTILKADGKNYLAIVTLSTNARISCQFTDSQSTLIKAINGMKANGGTNMNQAFQKADELLSAVESGTTVIKNVVLCSDGLPEDGAKAAKGRYKAKNHKFYKYANATYKTDVKLKNKGYFIYALGFFHNSTGKDLKFGKRLMKDLASKNRYYVVTKPKDIKKVFNKIASKIKKTTKNTTQKTTSSGSSKLSLNKTSLTIYVGQSVKLKAFKNGKKKDAKWSSANKSIAKVNKNGKVTGVAPGQTTVTAKINGKTVTCTVTVIIKHPRYSQYFMVNAQKSKYGSKLINEYGLRLVTNDDAVIRKCAIYVKQNSDGTYNRTMACTGDNITYAYMVPYLALNGTILYDGQKTSDINYFRLSKYSDGIWRLSNYSTIVANLEDANGNDLAVESTGIAGENTQIFDDLEAMKAWLLQ